MSELLFVNKDAELYYKVMQPSCVLARSLAISIAKDLSMYEGESFDSYTQRSVAFTRNWLDTVPYFMHKEFINMVKAWNNYIITAEVEYRAIQQQLIEAFETLSDGDSVEVTVGVRPSRFRKPVQRFKPNKR